MQTINIQKLNLLDKAKVLDLGCGEGRHCFGAYMHANLDVYGFDLNPDDVQKAIDNSEKTATALVNALSEGQLENAKAIGSRLPLTCSACHQRFRN